MTTSALSKLLKKKKLTGEEVGKIILLDLVNEHKGQPTLTQAEKDAYVDALVESKDIKAYNDYLQIYKLIPRFAIDFESEERAYHAIRVEFVRHIMRHQDAENNYIELTRQPRILTRRDYEQALKEAKESVSSWTYSLYSLVAYELNKNIEAYNNKEKTPYKRYFDAYKKEQSNEEVIKAYRVNYWQDKNNPKKDKELTKLVMLDKYLEIYNDAESEIKGGMLFFADHYPELLQAILENYSKLEGLEYLANLTTDDYTREDLIDFQTAYKLNILGARDAYDDPLLTFKGHDLTCGVAVIESAKWAKNNIKDGTYYYSLGPKPFKELGPFGLRLFRHLAEDVLANEDHISKIEYLKKQFKKIARNLVAFQYFMLKLVEITGVPELLAFNRDNGTSRLQYFEALASELWIDRYGLLEDEGDPVELGKGVRELYNLGFTVDDIQITEAEKEEVESIIRNAPSKTKAVIQTFNYLLTGAK
ncbi:hypothetical protein [Providencia stuartii]|uniref:hypothetical protein n=1 Tax=Providencia stuartii TaxID=588 RepID=UPI0024AB8091|nr:hypothetical protein [Providencia stuartii]MCX3072521.1 hypothetical protein [Providencia stuartii]